MNLRRGAAIGLALSVIALGSVAASAAGPATLKLTASPNPPPDFTATYVVQGCSSGWRAYLYWGSVGGTVIGPASGTQLVPDKSSKCTVAIPGNAKASSGTVWAQAKSGTSAVGGTEASATWGSGPPPPSPSPTPTHAPTPTAAPTSPPTAPAPGPSSHPQPGSSQPVTTPSSPGQVAVGLNPGGQPSGSSGPGGQPDQGGGGVNAGGVSGSSQITSTSVQGLARKVPGGPATMLLVLLGAGAAVAAGLWLMLIRRGHAVQKMVGEAAVAPAPASRSWLDPEPAPREVYSPPAQTYQPRDGVPGVEPAPPPPTAPDAAPVTPAGAMPSETPWASQPSPPVQPQRVDDIFALGPDPAAEPPPPPPSRQSPGMPPMAPKPPTD
jgi:hypothetical protein